MALELTVTKSDNITESLGIDKDRSDQLMNKLQEVGTASENTRLTDVAASVIDTEDCNINEIFYIGLSLGQMIA